MLKIVLNKQENILFDFVGSLNLFHLVRCSPWPSLVCDKIQAVCPHPRLIGRSRDKLKGKNRWRGSCHSQWLSRVRRRRFGIPQETRKRREVTETLQTCSCSLSGQEAFLAAGQHASVVQDELERPLPVLMEKSCRKFLPWTVFWHSRSWRKSIKHP